MLAKLRAISLPAFLVFFSLNPSVAAAIAFAPASANGAGARNASTASQNDTAVDSSVIHYGNQLNVDLNAFFTRLDATETSNDSHAHFNSDLAESLDLTERFKLMPGMGFIASAGLTQLDFKEATGRTVNGLDQTLFRAGAGLEFKLSRKLRMGLLLMLSQEDYYYADSSLNLSLDKTLIPKPALYLNYDLYNKDRLALCAQLKGAALLPVQASDYNTLFGEDYAAQLYAIYAYSIRTQFRIGAFYDTQIQNTNQLKLVRSDLGVSVSLTKLIGGIP